MTFFEKKKKIISIGQIILSPVGLVFVMNLADFSKRLFANRSVMILLGLTANETVLSAYLKTKDCFGSL